MNTLILSPWFQRTRMPDSLLGLALVVAAHLAIVWGVLHNRSNAPVIEPWHPLVVHLIAQETAQTETPKPLTRLLAARQRMTNPVATSPPTPAAPELTPRLSSLEPVALALQTSPAPTATATVTQPRFDAIYLNNPAPTYPGLSRRLREEGQVMLRVFVSIDGLPDKIELRQSSGFLRLDTAAQKIVQRWRFIPARLGEERVSAWVLVPISFSLRS